jgi:ABC-type Fe3+-siderophore transport system permease subunit
MRMLCFILAVICICGLNILLMLYTPLIIVDILGIKYNQSLFFDLAIFLSLTLNIIWFSLNIITISFIKKVILD